jgi:aspartate aminotransferase
MSMPYSNSPFAIEITAKEIAHKNGPLQRRGPADDVAFAGHLKDHLILSVPGSSFAGPGWMRFAYCVDEKIIKASSDSFQRAMDCW